MTESNEKTQETPPQKTQETPPQKTQETPPPQPQAQPASTNAPADKPAKKEKPAACEKCGKKLSEKAWYYRNGKYFCNKRCWKANA